jgi:hypothetical protein
MAYSFFCTFVFSGTGGVTPHWECPVTRLRVPPKGGRLRFEPFFAAGTRGNHWATSYATTLYQLSVYVMSFK